MKTLLGITILLCCAPNLLAADGPINAKTKQIECFCTDKVGARVELGEIICLHVDGRSYSARCEMSLNNPMWREIGSSCNTSRNMFPYSTAPAVAIG
jgi:hypothetical protein